MYSLIARPALSISAVRGRQTRVITSVIPLPSLPPSLFISSPTLPCPLLPTPPLSLFLSPFYFYLPPSIPPLSFYFPYISFSYFLPSPIFFLLPLLLFLPPPSSSILYSHLLLSCLCLPHSRSSLHPCSGSPHKEQSQSEGCKTATLCRT